MNQGYTDSSSANEKDFLTGYRDFTLNIRIYVLEILKNEYDSTEDIDIKAKVLVIMEEQFFFIMETFFGFSYAFIKINESKNNKSFVSLLETKFEVISNLHNELSKKSEDDIKKYFVIKEDMEFRLLNLIGIWTNEDFFKSLKIILIPNLDISKHKLLIYKKGSTIIKILDKNKQNQISELDEDIGHKYSKENIPSQEKYFLDMGTKINELIKDIINLRLMDLEDQNNIRTIV
jgi:hypothetical protein